jgi:hypothetical protein
MSDYSPPWAFRTGNERLKDSGDLSCRRYQKKEVCTKKGGKKERRKDSRKE